MAGGNKGNKKQNKQAKKLIQEKESSKKTTSTSSTKSSCCRWMFGSFLLFAIIVGVITYDTHIHGAVFKQSATGQFLKKTGALPYVEIGWEKTMSVSARGYKWTADRLPIYFNVTCTALQPYVEFLKDFKKIVCNGLKSGWNGLCEYVNLKSPIVIDFIEQYAPGLPEKIGNFTISMWNVICNATTTICTNTTEFFKTKVFVGNLSPENLSKALNQTQKAAAKYYRWFNNKVDAYAKIQ